MSGPSAAGQITSPTLDSMQSQLDLSVDVKFQNSVFENENPVITLDSSSLQLDIDEFPPLAASEQSEQDTNYVMDNMSNTAPNRTVDRSQIWKDILVHTNAASVKEADVQYSLMEYLNKIVHIERQQFKSLVFNIFGEDRL